MLINFFIENNLSIIGIADIRYDDEAKKVLKSIKNIDISALEAHVQQATEAKFLEKVQ